MSRKIYYNPSKYGKSEEELIRKFILQKNDAKKFFIDCIKPRLDRSYKLYIAWNGDRAKEIKKWQANIFVPYTQAVIETLAPRVLDARPEFTIMGRNEASQRRAPKNQQVVDYTWEISKADSAIEDMARSAMTYGTGFLQTSWKKDVRELEFLISKDMTSKKLIWKKEKKTFYDAPYLEWVDNYSLWYDWHNIKRETKQFWFKRLVLAGAEIKRRYPLVDKIKLEMALNGNGNADLTDYAYIRSEVKTVHEKINKGSDFGASSGISRYDVYQSNNDPDLKMHEVFEWWRPFDDAFSVLVNEVPILKGSVIPCPYDHKESPFIDIPYLRLPGEFEGYGLPMILENPQIMLNMIKNQRLDAATLNIHKMWIVNPLANINKSELVTRPFGIIYSTDPAGVKEVQFSDIKESSYSEERLLKEDMRYASGIDDFSMGVGGGAGSATEIRHLRESTLERVRLFINHMGDGLSVVMRHWLTMYRQFFTEKMTIRIIGDDGVESFPIVEKDDLMGEFDFKATVLPSISGKSDVDKKQNMDLYQLLINLPFVDPRKLVTKVLQPWNWNLESVSVDEQQSQEAPMMEEGGLPASFSELKGTSTNLKNIPESVANEALAKLGVNPSMSLSPFMEASSPIDLLTSGVPPTVAPIGNTTNPRGMNRSGKVNTNIPGSRPASIESNILSRANNIQR